MKSGKIKLILYSFVVFFYEIKSDFLKWVLTNREEVRIEKDKVLSDIITVRISKWCEKSGAKQKKIKSKFYKIIQNMSRK